MLKASSTNLITGSLEISAEEIRISFENRTAREKPVIANLSASLKTMNRGGTAEKHVFVLREQETCIFLRAGFSCCNQLVKLKKLLTR